MLFGGLAFFLYGMNILSSGLSKLAGGSLERSLKRMTSNRWKALALGAVVGAIVAFRVKAKREGRGGCGCGCDGCALRDKCHPTTPDSKNK